MINTFELRGFTNLKRIETRVSFPDLNFDQSPTKVLLKKQAREQFEKDGYEVYEVTAYLEKSVYRKDDRFNIWTVVVWVDSLDHKLMEMGNQNA